MIFLSFGVTVVKCSTVLVSISIFNTLISTSQSTIQIHPRATLVFLILLSLSVVVIGLGVVHEASTY